MKRLFALGAGALLAVVVSGQSPRPLPVQKAQGPQGLVHVLRVALADERASHAYCQAVIAKFGARPAFAQVVEGEGLHAALVEELMFRHKVPVPKNILERQPKETKKAFAERLKVPATYPEAVQQAIQMERRQGPLYNRLSPGMPDDVSAVFGKLRREALERHLPAFQVPPK